MEQRRLTWLAPIWSIGRMRPRILALLLLAALPAAAPAEERPRLVPSRDVTVEYSVDSSRPMPFGRNFRVAIKAGGARLRAEPTDRADYLLVERAGGRVQLVMAQQHAVLDLPGRAPIDAWLLNDRMHFKRLGEDRVAAVNCTVWSAQDGARTATGCLTADGVLLRGETVEQGRTERLVATGVTYGAVPEGRFVVPADFRKLDISGLAQLGRGLVR